FPGANPCCRLGEHAPRSHRPIVADRIYQPCWALPVRVADVEQLAVGREAKTVGRLEVRDDGAQDAVAAESIDALERQFLGRIVECTRKPKRRVVEVKITVGRVDQVVGTVEPSSLVPIGEDGLTAVDFAPYDAPVAVLTAD